MNKKTSLVYMVAVYLIGSLFSVGCTVREEGGSIVHEINKHSLDPIAVLPGDGTYGAVPENLIQEISENAAVKEGVANAVEVKPLDPLTEIPKEIPSSLGRGIIDINYGGPTSRLYLTSYGELNVYLGQPLLRYGQINRYYYQWISSAADSICSRMGWTGGGVFQWVNANNGQVCIACVHGVKRWVPGYFYGSVGIPQVNGHSYDSENQHIFNDSGAARGARNLGGSQVYGGLMLHYGGGASIISLLYSCINKAFNVYWGATYGINYNNGDSNRYFHTRTLAGHICRTWGYIFGVMTELNGSTGAATFQCGR